jgi:hypothetical protein
MALGVAERDGNGKVVDDVQHRHDQDEGHVVPVRDVDMRFLAAGQRAKIDQEISDPDHDQPDIGIPFRLGIFLGLGNPHHVAGDGEQAEQVVAKEHKPWAELVRQARARGALQYVERGCDQPVSTETEYD